MCRIAFYALIGTVALCQALDTAFAVHYIDVIHEYNPFCEAVLAAGPWAFLACKACGLAVVLWAIWMLRRWRPWAGWAAAVSTAAAMVWVVVFQLV